jgi:hypothetical protein
VLEEREVGGGVALLYRAEGRLAGLWVQYGYVLVWVVRMYV